MICGQDKRREPLCCWRRIAVGLAQQQLSMFAVRFSLKSVVVRLKSLHQPEQRRQAVVSSFSPKIQRMMHSPDIETALPKIVLAWEANSQVDYCGPQILWRLQVSLLPKTMNLLALLANSRSLAKVAIEAIATTLSAVNDHHTLAVKAICPCLTNLKVRWIE